MTATCENLEIHVAHGCNLTCESCAHFSNQGHRGLLSPADAVAWFQEWKGRLLPQSFSILGGEPTLNPALSDIVRLSREYWPESKLVVVTNGFLLERHDPQLPIALAETGATLHISIHFDSVEYEAKLEPVQALVDAWIDRYDINVWWRQSDDKWTRRYQGWGPTLKPFQDEDQRASWEHCNARWCVQLHEGKLWKCPPLAYLPMQADRHGLGPEWDRYLTYRPLAPSCTDEELAEFLAREDEHFCEMCPASPQRFHLPSPLIPLGSLLRQHQGRP